MRFDHNRGGWLAAAWLLLTTAGAAAQQPAPDLLIINPYPATGAVDIAGTVVMSKALRSMQSHVTPSTTDALVQQLQLLLAEGLEKPVDVRRQPRSGGEAAAGQMLTAPGPVLLFAGSGLASNAAVRTLRSLQPVALTAQVPSVLVIHAGDRNDARQWIARSRASTQAPQWGTAGERSTGNELLNRMRRSWPAGLTAVAFNGGNGALRGVLALQVPAALVPLPAALPYAGNQQLRILALAAADRHRALPAVPTLGESGLPGVQAGGWHGLFAPPAMAADLIAPVQRVLAKSLQAESVRQAIAMLGYAVDAGDAAALRMALVDEVRRMAGSEAQANMQAADLSVRLPPAVSPR